MFQESRAEASLQAERQRITRRRSRMPAPQVRVDAPGWSFRFGDVDRPFHAACAGKLLTATLIAMHVEDGRFGFDTPIGRLLPAPDVAGLPGAPGVDVAKEVTVEHLLAQTSGIPDFFEPARGRRTAASARSAVRDRDRRWTPAALLDEARTLPAVGRPGERFHYSDTGYVLLGRIAEEAGGAPFATQLRTRIFEPTGMASASTPYDAALIPDDLSELDVQPFWLHGAELSRAHSVSLDWAGGNVVATPDDFVRFQRALHGGTLISPETVAHLSMPRSRFRRGIRYGAGTMTLRFAELAPPPFLRGLSEPVGHLGVWATHVFYHREHNAHVVLNFHAASLIAMNQSFQVHARIARILANR